MNNYIMIALKYLYYILKSLVDMKYFKEYKIKNFEYNIIPRHYYTRKRRFFMNNEVNTQETTDQRQLLIAVAFNHDTNTYYVDLGKGSNVAETAFAVTVIIKCLLKDGVIKDAAEFTNLVTKYLNDPQYDEVKDTEN